MRAQKRPNLNSFSGLQERPINKTLCNVYRQNTSTRNRRAASTSNLQRAYVNVLGAKTRQDQIKACGRWFAMYARLLAYESN